MKERQSRKLFAVIIMLSIILGLTGTIWIVSDVRAEKEGASSVAGSVRSGSVVSGKDGGQSESEGAEYVPGEVVVKFKPERISLRSVSGEKKAEIFAENKSLDKKEDLLKVNISVLEINDGKTVEEKVAELEKDPNVEYVQPNFQYYPSVIGTDDTYKNNLWGLDNTGQTVNGVAGTADADIDIPEAWAVKGSANVSVVVAVIDSGVAYDHPDLINDMWDGSACKNENGVYLGSCNHGFDFEDGDRTPLPNTNSHGTHIAGTIAAAKNNGVGIVGVAPSAEIMAVKVSLDTVNIIKGINFAKQNGAKVINASWGGSASSCTEAFDQALYSAIQSFDGLFVVAAGNGDGNGGKNHDGSTYFDSPSDYGHTTACWAGLDNIISVAATNQNDALASFSDYGANYVDVGAPGVNIYSTVSGDIEGVLISNETFEAVTTPALPGGWIVGGTDNRWGTHDLGYDWGNVLFGDLDYPYASSADTSVTSPVYDLGSAQGANLGFWAGCDTEYSLNSWTDYMALEYSSDDFVTHIDISEWDEPYLDDDLDQSGGVAAYLSYNIPSKYLTGNFKFRFRWVTNSSLNDFNGCFVDDVKLTKYTDVDGSSGEYDYYSGTSMATPHVAGLAALILGYKPDLTSSEVKAVILTTGDSLPTLVGKTVTGKRVNAFNALNSLTPPDVTAPVLREITLVPVSTVNRVPAYAFSSDEAGAVTYSGSCGNGDISQAIAGTNTATFHLNVGIYSDCAITVTDSSNNPSTTLSIPPFTITPAANFGKAILSFSFAQGEGIIDEVNHTITATVPYGTNVTTLSPTVTISAGASVFPASATAQNFTTPRTYTVTTEDSFSNQPYIVSVIVSSDPDIALLLADKEALVEGSILGANSSLGNITVALASPLPVSGSVNGSVITWSSSAPQAVSNDGQTVTRPYFSAGDLVVTMTATLTKGIVTNTKPFVLTVTKLLASPIANITSSAYTIDAGTIGNVPFGTTKTAFLVAIAKGESHQTWDESGLSDPVATGNILTVTAEDGATTTAYSITVLPNTAKDITSFRFESLNPVVTGTISGINITLAVPYNTDTTALIPTIAISQGATVSPASGVAQDFTVAKTYIVTAADNSTKTYTVAVNKESAPRSSSSGGGGGGGPYIPPVTSVSAFNESLQVKSTQEGILRWSLGGQNEVKVSIPKGSVGSSTTFSIEKGNLSGVGTSENETGALLFSDLIFDVNAKDENNTKVKSFDQYLTITLTVSSLPEDKTGLKLYYFDETNKKWVRIENIVLGTDTITFTINHLTRFAVFETKQAITDKPADIKADISVAVASVTVSDGDIIQSKDSANPFAVYIVKIVDNRRYVRHIMSLEIFNHYKHLKWENLKQVDSLEGFSLSGWVRVNTGANGNPGANDKVYEINGDQTRHWINMSAQQFLTHGGSEEAIYNINQGELDLYKNGAEVISL